ncbi:restriction endonuclease [Streptomyces sp. CRN 30]|uniref:restriction endonuclease n=1 Tax=Streptomyces sp. CRN 30 TaxID=3075613 RepID=UPI002A840D54|nr:restriction endonuclease [Streptomyces sp. CRN 30]
MISDTALLESPTLRDSVRERTDVLDRVKVLALLPDGVHVTTAMVAAYFGVTIEAVRALVHDHRPELEASGYRVLTGPELSYFKHLSGIRSRSRSLALFPRRAVLNVAMLLRDSETARQVRVYLLDAEQSVRPQPVDNPLDIHIDRRVTRILGVALVPMFNALIATAVQHHRELTGLRESVEDLERRLEWHHRRLITLEESTSPDSPDSPAR